MDVLNLIAPDCLEPMAARSSDAGPARILVVEDERLVARELEERLTEIGHFVVASVASGEGAIEQVRALKPELVLMDIKLEGPMDGIRAAEIIRRETGLPVIYLTAFADEHTLQRAKLTEPYGYILKPFQERELRVNIEMSLHRHRVGRQLREQQVFRDVVLRNVREAIIATGLDGRVRLINERAEALTGWTASDAIGRSVEEVFSLARDRLIARDGTEHRIEQHTTELRDGDHVLGLLRTFRGV